MRPRLLVLLIIIVLLAACSSDQAETELPELPTKTPKPTSTPVDTAPPTLTDTPTPRPAPKEVSTEKIDKMCPVWPKTQLYVVEQIPFGDLISVGSKCYSGAGGPEVTIEDGIVAHLASQDIIPGDKYPEMGEILSGPVSVYLNMRKDLEDLIELGVVLIPPSPTVEPSIKETAIAYNELSLELTDQGDYDKAIEYLDKAIELDPNYANAYYNRARNHDRKYYYEDAISDYSRAIELDPEFAWAYVNRGWVYSAMGDYDQAIRNYTKGIELDPSDKLAFYDRGDIYLYQGNYELAVDDYTKAINIDPDYKEALFNRAIAYAELDQSTDAIKDLERAIELGVSEDEKARANIYIDNISSVLSSTSSGPSSTPTPFPDPVSISNVEKDFPPLITDEIGVTMVYVPEGSFTMGEDAKFLADTCSESSVIGEECPLEEFEDAAPHTVYLDGFYIDQTEVSIQRYLECVDEGVCANPRGSESMRIYDYVGNPQYYDYPVNWVSPEYAEEYCKWRNARLPTEAEWEKSARGTEGRIFPWGDTFIPGLANYCDVKCVLRGYNEPVPVGSYPAGASPFGVLNLAGNMAEWVSDLYDADYYSNSPEDNPKGPDTSDSGHVIRGGSYSWGIGNMLSAYRNIQWSNSSNVVGFRCVRNP